MRAAGILFDKDGTLFDFEATFAPACAAVALELAGGDAALANRLCEAVGFDMARQRFLPSSIVIAGTAGDIGRSIAGTLGLPAGEELARRIDALFEKHTTDYRLFDDTLAMLERFVAAGLPVGMATNDAEANGRTHARIAGIDSHFRFFAGYDSGHGPKPGPGMILAFAAAIGASPAEIVMVGDSLHDLHAAKAAGAIAVGVTTGLAPRAMLEPHADYVVDSLQALAQLPPIAAVLGAQFSETALSASMPSTPA